MATVARQNDLCGGSDGRTSEYRRSTPGKPRLRRAVRPLHETRWCLDTPVTSAEIASRPFRPRSPTGTTRYRSPPLAVGGFHQLLGIQGTGTYRSGVVVGASLRALRNGLLDTRGVARHPGTAK